MAQDLDLLLEKACSTPEGRLKSTFIMAELQKLAPAFHDATTREAAEEALTAWADLGGDPLRKGMAMAWLSRARSAIMPHVADALKGATHGVNAVRAGAAQVSGAAAAGAGAVKGAVARAQNAAGNLGAAAGEKIANSPLRATKRAALEAQGGAKAQSRMADRLKARDRVEPFYRKETGADLAQEGGPHARMEPRVDPHADALRDAFRQGAEHAKHIHAKASARIGRIAARHAFKAGAMLGAAGTGAAAAGALAGHLSQKEHDQRVAAGKHSHDRHRAAPSGFAKPGAV